MIGLGTLVRAFFFLSYRPPRSVLGPGWSLFARLFAFLLPSRRPPHSVLGHGLGNRAAKLRHGTVGFSCSFFLSSCRRPPQLRAGGRPGSSGYSHGGTGLYAAQDCMLCLLFFVMHVVLFSLCYAFSARHFTPSRDRGLYHLSISFWFSPFVSSPPPPRW